MATPKADTEEPHKAAYVPPKTTREKFIHALPVYTGPYNVGYMDIEVPARDPRPISNLRRDGKPVLRLDTVLMAVYYPCDLQDDLLSPDETKRLHRANWMPRPRIPTAKGYAKFMNVPETAVTSYMACTALFTKLPAFRNAKIANHWPEDMLGDEGPGGRRARREEQSSSRRPKFPVIVFSHGLGGSRLSYSTICGELASFGFIVIAVEHRDGSGARTYVSLPSNKSAALIESSTAELHRVPSGRPKTSRRKVTFRSRQRGKSKTNPYYVVDYIYPKNNALDTSPHNDQGVDHELRQAQLDLRQEEIEEAFYTLQLLNSGRGKEVATKNLRKKGNIGSSSLGLDGIDWSEWQDRMFIHDVTVMGHSFGGATTVQVCRDDSLSWIGQGILLDAWGLATPLPGEAPQDKLTKPVISIASEAFMHWKENFDRLVGICNEAREAGALCWMLTIAGSTHLAMTDFAVLYPGWMSVLMKSMMSPTRALYLTVTTSLEFLKMTLPQDQTKYNRWTDEQLLRTGDPPSEPDEVLKPDHAPDDKWIAFRLRIPNELSMRTKAWVRLQQRRLLCTTDRATKADAGLVTFEKDDEIWTHFNPSHDELQDRRTRQSTDMK